MKPTELLEVLPVAEKLKCNTRHCWLSNGLSIASRVRNEMLAATHR